MSTIRGSLRILILVTTALTSASAASDPAGLAQKVTIYRDNFGVPHVWGPTDPSCVFGYIYAQAEDNFWQIEDSYLHAIGRAAEVYGERALSDDLLVRAMEIEKLSKAELERASPRAKEMVEAFAAALNYYLARNPQVKPRLITRFEPWHIYAFNRYALYALFLFRQTGLDSKEVQKAAETQGSNMWAIMPQKSANGHSMLFINPHQPFFGPGQWYEGHVHSDEGWNLSGASFFGAGFPTIGHNDVLGWSHTVNKPDVFDIYEETFDKAGDPLAYRYDGGYRKAVEWSETVRVKTATGIEERTYKLRKTHHGPVLANRNGKALAVKFARLEEGGQMDEWYAMGRARNLGEFKSAMAKTAIPMFNTMYADRDGNIFYVYNGAVPRRATQYDWLKPVDGSNAETEWHGYHPFDELPQLTNPKSGFLQNCNSTPFLTTVGENPDETKYPKYMVGDPDTARARISRRILWNKDKFTFAEWAKAGFDTTVIEAETEIPKAAQQWEALRSSDRDRAARLKDAITELREWDHISRVDSIPMTLFTLTYLRRVRDPKNNPDTLRTLEAVMADLEKSFGTWRVKWGEINRLERAQSGGEEPFSDGRMSVPVPGGPGDVGIVFNFYSRPEKGQKRMYGVAGHSFVSVIEFGPEVKAQSILVFGENSDPQSPHYFDQSKLYAKQEFKPAWFSLADIREHAERTYHPGER
jgi:acyl-homoserine-lactone acylase